jgi:uncharacterized RDD family membrane protein YckC
MTKYPQLNLRWKAAIIDSFIFLSLLFSTAYFSYDIFQDNLFLRIIFIFLPTLSYEPLMIFFTGRSLGHKLYGIGVVHQDDSKKLNLFQCYIRYIVKIALGLFSLIFMFLTHKRQAFHDLITASLVVFVDNKVTAHF